jgi:HAD superfamily hydrolase (TIGR01484 family)
VTPVDLATPSRPLAAWPAAARAGLRGLMTDIDDTLTRDGAIEPAALEALHALAAAGLPVVAITGRPAGWSEPFAMAWPVAAIVAENGAVALMNRAGRLERAFVQDAATRAHHARRLAEVLARIEREVPGARRAQDSAGRLTDIAIDHSEFTQLPPAAIDAVVALMRAEGLTATVSSIHVNGWFGTHDKFSGACWMARELFGVDLQAELAHWAYVGDSTNDQVMFERFPHSVGVANLVRFAAQLTHWPAYLAPAERGAGFAQVAQAVLQARRPQGRQPGAAA